VLYACHVQIVSINKTEAEALCKIQIKTFRIKHLSQRKMKILIVDQVLTKSKLQRSSSKPI